MIHEIVDIRIFHVHKSLLSSCSWLLLLLITIIKSHRWNWRCRGFPRLILLIVMISSSWSNRCWCLLNAWGWTLFGHCLTKLIRYGLFLTGRNIIQINSSCHLMVLVLRNINIISTLKHFLRDRCIRSIILLFLLIELVLILLVRTLLLWRLLLLIWLLL